MINGMARKLVCTNCGEEFEYSKRGPSPKVPLCPNCKTSTEKEMETTQREQVKTNANKVPPAAAKNVSKKEKSTDKDHFEYYYEFTGPSESEKPFEPGEKLYVVPKLYYSERRIHTRGRVVEFVEYREDNPDLVKVRVHFKRLGKKVTEITTTKKDRLRRFKKVRIPKEDIDVPALDDEGSL